MSVREAILNSINLNEMLPRTATKINGHEFYVATITSGERDDYEIAQFAANQSGARSAFRARLIVHTARNEDGSRTFTEADVAALSCLPEPAIREAFKAATKLNPTDREGSEKNQAKNS